MNIEERITRLERQNRFLKLAGAVAIILIAFLALVPSDRRTETQELIIKDIDGGVAAKLNRSGLWLKDGGMIRISDLNGDRVRLTKEGIVYYDEKGKPKPASSENKLSSSKSILTQKNSHLKGFEDEVISHGPLFEGGVISVEVDSLKKKPMRIETGSFRGLKYQIYYSDGSGSLQGNPDSTLDYDNRDKNWHIVCKIDKMDDSRWCYLSREDLILGIWKDGSYYVSVGYNHQPGSKISVRVDKNEPISALESKGFSSLQARKIIEQLKSGNTVLTRYQKWQYKADCDKSFTPDRFSEAWELLQVIYNSVEVN